ncbi:MAG: hypothetical protein GDA46_05880 [Bdellovibrionales bacterium]|nr:hypothetical protein [Bdellovibrionales bacterium]
MKKILIFFIFLSHYSYAKDYLKDLELSQEDKSSKLLEIKNISDLQKITPYDSISVIQKRYLPKTFRAEFNLSLSSNINHSFFYFGGVSGRLGFFVREDHGFGVEALYLFGPIFKVVTNNIINGPNKILPNSLFLSEFYTGVYYKWSPIFGKFALLDKSIIYFDTYMTIGGGGNKILDGQEVIKEKIADQPLRIKNEKRILQLSQEFFPALSLSLGQTFSINKNWAFNWELKWLYTFVSETTGRMHVPLDINFSLGFNYYFPESSYR